MTVAQSNIEAQPLPKSLFGYDVHARIGHGAASTIYAVSEPKTNQVFALKHVIRHTEKDDRFIAQLENEFNVSRQFRHPALRRYFEFKINRTLFRKVTDAALVMELVDATPIDQQKPKELPVVIDIFIQTAKALSGLHYLLYVHCDLKPNNILFDAKGKVKLIDFGQAAKVGTIKERIQGTPDFISPEQVKLKPISIKTDIYAFGASLYWALSGQRVPTLFTVKKSERDIVTENRFPKPKELNPAIPDALSDLIMRCVQMEPPRRPRDMGEIIDQLSALNGKAA
jgi:serine/threonine protein kinase